ncbi:exodeoxyribonuclease VII large subunit [Woeseiaceae bacterium]|jgi:exodeoxyribonuclease VII large subunit|nr:exodeoxyribonuclease VII large subunit [Woeseiaceae bacterium]
MDDLFTQVTPPKIISVSELNRKAKSLLEGGIPKLWIEGEISNLARPASGHMYFSLKDEAAQIRCAWFKQRQHQNTMDIANGTKMLALGKISLYEARGEYQFIVEKMETAGEGDLKRKYEKLKEKLAIEGFFAEEIKKSLPKLPTQIGIITSPSGAAIRDALSVLKRRFPMVPIIIYPVSVQGAAAAPEIKIALEKANKRAECDLLIITRGGGSLEDLWAFNEEIVARAIHQSDIPIISAVGHETDVTIADFVADHRAPTPSAAAEIAVPDQQEWFNSIENISGKLNALIIRVINNRHQSIDWFHKRLSQSSPQVIVRRQIEKSINLQRVLKSSIKNLLIVRGREIDKLTSRCIQNSPSRSLQKQIMRIEAIKQNIYTKGKKLIEDNQNRLQLASQSLNSVSPLGTLDRGYAIVSEAKTNKIITNPSSLKINSKLEIQLAKGKITAAVLEKNSI